MAAVPAVTLSFGSCSLAISAAEITMADVAAAAINTPRSADN